MTIDELVAKLRAKLAQSAAAKEPDDWPVSIEKSELHILLDELERFESPSEWLLKGLYR